jgi:hypothetical protein
MYVLCIFFNFTTVIYHATFSIMHKKWKGCGRHLSLQEAKSGSSGTKAYIIYFVVIMYNMKKNDFELSSHFNPPFLHLQTPYRYPSLITMTFHNFRGVRHVECLLLFATSMIHVYFLCAIAVFRPVTSPLHVEALSYLLPSLQLRTSSELH